MSGGTGTGTGATRALPADAVVLTLDEATDYAWELVGGWSDVSQTWALRFGSGLLGGLSGIGGILLNQHFRTRLRVGTYGHFASLLPIVALPGIFTALFHREYVSTSILMRKEPCFICQELRSAAIQCTLGVVYPMFLAPTTAFMLANRYNTYRLPSLNKEPKELFQFLKKISRPLTGLLSGMLVAHCIASSVITYFEMRNCLAVMKKMEDIERRIDAKQSLS